MGGKKTKTKLKIFSEQKEHWFQLIINSTHSDATVSLPFKHSSLCNLSIN